MNSGSIMENTASRAWAWSALSVSSVRVFSLGPALPTPMREGYTFLGSIMSITLP